MSLLVVCKIPPDLYKDVKENDYEIFASDLEPRRYDDYIFRC